MPQSSGGSHTSGFPWKADSPRFVDDGRTHAGDGRNGSERCSARNPRSSVTAMVAITAPLSSRTAGDRSMEASAQVAAMGQSDPLPRGVIRCRFIFSGKNDEPTPDFPTPDFPTPDFLAMMVANFASLAEAVWTGGFRLLRTGVPPVLLQTAREPRITFPCR